MHLGALHLWKPIWCHHFFAYFTHQWRNLCSPFPGAREKERGMDDEGARHGMRLLAGLDVSTCFEGLDASLPRLFSHAKSGWCSKRRLQIFFWHFDTLWILQIKPNLGTNNIQDDITLVFSDTLDIVIILEHPGSNRSDLGSRKAKVAEEQLRPEIWSEGWPVVKWILSRLYGCTRNIKKPFVIIIYYLFYGDVWWHLANHFQVW